MSDSSAAIARTLHIDGMGHHWTHLAAQVIKLLGDAGCVLTFLDRVAKGFEQKSVWQQPDNDTGYVLRIIETEGKSNTDIAKDILGKNYIEPED